jgi:hypothetical protein
VIERPMSRIAMAPARRTQIAALTIACCTTLVTLYVLYQWMSEIPIVDLRL